MTIFNKIPSTGFISYRPNPPEGLLQRIQEDNEKAEKEESIKKFFFIAGSIFFVYSILKMG